MEKDRTARRGCPGVTSVEYLLLAAAVGLASLASIEAFGAAAGATGFASDDGVGVVASSMTTSLSGATGTKGLALTNVGGSDVAEGAGSAWRSSIHGLEWLTNFYTVYTWYPAQGLEATLDVRYWNGYKARYERYSHGTLFHRGQPSWKDISQGNVGDCFLMASWEAVAATDPSLIKHAMHGIAGGYGYAVRLFQHGKARMVRPNGKLFQSNTLVAGHAYMVQNVNRQAGTVTLRNPWGPDERAVTLTADELQTYLSSVTINPVH